MLSRSFVLLTLLLALTTCSYAPYPSEVQVVKNLMQYYNDILPVGLPEFPTNGDGPAIYLAAPAGKRSYLIRPDEAADHTRFPLDTLHGGYPWDYLTFHDTTTTSYNYSGSVYAPSDSSRFGPNARVLEMSTRKLYRADNPEFAGLDYLAVFIHETAHTTERYRRPPGLPGMMDQMIAFEQDSVLREQITAENQFLLAAIASSDTVSRNAFIRDYLTRKAARASTSGFLDMTAESCYELKEGYGRYLEHLGQLHAHKRSWPLLEVVFGPLATYEMEPKKWMYEIKGNDYYYVLGFNKIRLLAGADAWEFSTSIEGKSDRELDDYLRMLIDE